MFHFHNMSLRWQLISGLGAALALMFASGGMAIGQLSQEVTTARSMLDTEAQGAVLSQQMRAGLLLQVQALKNTWLRGSDPEQFRKYAAEFDDHATRLRGLRTKFEDIRPRLTPDEQALVRTFDNGWEQYLTAWPAALKA